MKKFALAVALLALWAIEPVNAAEFFCSSGDVTCLIAAINNANLTQEPDTIFLESGTYRVGQLPTITTPISIREEALNGTIEADRSLPFDLGPLVFFDIAETGKLSLYGFWVQNSSFGAIDNRGILELELVSVRNHGTPRFSFPILRNSGKAVIFRSEVTGNGVEAGGVITNSGELEINRSAVYKNFTEGSGLMITGGRLTIIDSSVVENTATSSQAAGGIISVGTAVIINSTIAKNDLRNPIRFGAVLNADGLTLINSTVAENRGGGIRSSSGQLQNAIVAENVFAGPQDCQGLIVSLGNNVIGDTRNCDFRSQPTDLIGDPKLDEFRYGGEFDLQGHLPLLSDSPAIDSANPAACPATDQLRLPRVGNCDRGSVEFQDGRMLVTIDIRPRSDANKVNPNSTKDINVAILSGNGFDARTIDPNSVWFGATGTEAAPVHVGRRDVDGDGDRDVVVRFQIQDTGIKCGNTSAILTGQISGGPSIIGSSSITTVQCKK